MPRHSRVQHHAIAATQRLRAPPKKSKGRRVAPEEDEVAVGPPRQPDLGREPRRLQRRRRRARARRHDGRARRADSIGAEEVAMRAAIT